MVVDISTFVMVWSNEIKIVERFPSLAYKYAHVYHLKGQLQIKAVRCLEKFLDGPISQVSFYQSPKTNYDHQKLIHFFYILLEVRTNFTDVVLQFSSPQERLPKAFAFSLRINF